MVVGIKAGALKGHTEVAKHLTQLALAVRANLQRFVGKRLLNVEFVLAVFASV
ncbi:MAG: hypothetical protein RLZZ590_1119 [Actinomycetota bacterium]